MTRDTSDWDPLPTEQTGLHPGEAQKYLGGPPPPPPAQNFVVARTGAPGSAFGAVAPASKARPAAADSSAKQRSNAIAIAPRPQDKGPAPAQDMLPALLRPQFTPMQSEMLRQPGQAPRVASRESLAPRSAPKAESRVESKVVVKEAVSPASPTNSVAPAACGGIDARQQQPWFLAMPVVEQMRLLQVWQQERDQVVALSTARASRRDRLLERFWVAYVVFFIAALPLMLTEGMMGFVRMAMAGCVTGLLWQVVPHTRVACAWSAVFAYVAVAMLPRAGDLVAAPFSLLTSLGGAALVYWLAGLGAAHEQQPDRKDSIVDD